ncbi:MAG TPA: Dabb family protein [Acidimicrobiales bacterium]|nr:Dabb family protein [Acidimicrobiales bacterium]
MLMFRFKAEVAQQDRERMLAELAQFPNRFPAMRNFALGCNESKRDDSFTHAMTIEFESWSDLDSYLSSPEHESFVGERFRPLIAQRAIATFDDASRSSGGGAAGDQQSR